MNELHNKKSLIVQIWEITLNFIKDIANNIMEGNISSAIFQLGIVVSVLLSAIAVICVIAPGFDSQDKKDCVLYLGLLICLVFCIVLVAAIRRTPRDRDLANGQDDRYRKINGGLPS